MKRYIHSAEEAITSLEIDEIVSIVFVDDVEDYNPREEVALASKGVNYNNLTREQLLQLPKKELERIHDVEVLRKLKRDELTLNQYMELSNANKENFVDTIKKVKEILFKLKSKNKVFITWSQKNQSFADKLAEMGADITDVDARNILRQLHVKDYSYSTLSYLDRNWNALLMVFEYKGTYTFKSVEEGGHDVTVDSLNVYIKIDVDNETKKGYAVMSFHDPEFDLKHPYKDYPIDKE